MIPILFPAGTTNFTTNGLGRLADATDCTVVEERNSQYELTMTYPVTGSHFQDIAHSRIIYAVPADGKKEQPFRIYSISKPLNGITEIKAEHVSYQLSHIPVSPFTALSVTSALATLQSNAEEECPFTFWTDKSTTGKFTVKAPSSIRSLLGGQQGSVLDVYGGEYEFDEYTVKLHNSRGSDRGVTLRYGKNITDIRQEENIANTYTGIFPYWLGSDTESTSENEKLVMLPEKVLHSNNAQYFPYQRTIPLDLSSEFENPPTEEQLRARAQSYMTVNNIGIPSVSIDVSFIALWQTEEYKTIANLERVNLCDIVTVEFPALGISAKAKVVRTEFDVLKEKYKKIEIGDARTNLGRALLDDMEETVDNATGNLASKTFLQKSVERATKLLTGGLGGYVVMNLNANGQPEEILIMDQPDTETATNVIRMNKNGIGFSTTGYEGPFQSAWTIDGHFVADFIDTGNLQANLIKTGRLQDAANQNYWDMVTGEFRLAATTQVGDSKVASTDDLDDFVTETDVEYGNSSSQNTPPTTWTTNAAWEQGKYLWTRTKMTLADGTVQYSEARRIANDKGLGVSSVEEQYYLSTSNTGQYGGTWSTTQPTWTKDCYYWTRSKITWSDGTVTYTDPVLAKALTSGNQSTNDLDESYTQQKIFNRLTNNGETQGIYLSNGKLYINATYIATGTLADAGNNTMFNLSTGALTMNKGSINIGNGRFQVSSTGYLTAQGADINGEFTAGTNWWIKLNQYGELAGGNGDNQHGYIDFSASAWDIPMQQTLKGIQIQGDVLRISTYRIAAAQSTDVQTTAYNGGTGKFTYVSKIVDNGNGTITWTTSGVRFINGLMCSELSEAW